MMNIKKTSVLPIVLCAMLSMPLFAKDNNVTVVNDSANSVPVIIENDSINPVPVIIENDSTNPTSVIIENTSQLEVVVKKTPYTAIAKCFDQTTDTFKYCFVSIPADTYFEVKTISGGTQTTNVISMVIQQRNNSGHNRYYAPSLTVSIPQARNAFVADGFYIIEDNKAYIVDGKQYDARIIIETEKPHNSRIVYLHGWLHTIPIQ